MIEKPVVFNYYTYGRPYYGGYRGIRYSIVRQGEKPDYKLAVVTWPEPYCIDVTPDEEKVRKEFSFDESGYDEALVWLNGQFED